MKTNFKTLFIISSFIFISPLLFSQTYTVVNPHFNGTAPSTISGWDGVTVDSRENGPYNGTILYQAVNSPYDTETASGSLVFTSGAAFCSLSQALGITAQGQTVSIYADIAWDGDWDRINFGFYDATSWDIIAGCSVDIAPLVTADTDGILDSFTTVEIKDVVLPTSGAAVRVFIGTSCTPWTSGPKTIGTSKFAIDNIRAVNNSSETNWNLY